MKKGCRYFSGGYQSRSFLWPGLQYPGEIGKFPGKNICTYEKGMPERAAKYTWKGLRLARFEMSAVSTVLYDACVS